MPLGRREKDRDEGRGIKDKDEGKVEGKDEGKVGAKVEDHSPDRFKMKEKIFVAAGEDEALILALTVVVEQMCMD